MFDRHNLQTLFLYHPRFFDAIIRLPLICSLDYVLRGNFMNHLKGISTDIISESSVSDYISFIDKEKFIVIASETTSICSMCLLFTFLLCFIVIQTNLLVDGYTIILAGLAFYLQRLLCQSLLSESISHLDDNILTIALDHMIAAAIFNMFLISLRSDRFSSIPDRVLENVLKQGNFVIFLTPPLVGYTTKSHISMDLAIKVSEVLLSIQMLIIAAVWFYNVLYYFRHIVHAMKMYIQFMGLGNVLDAELDRLNFPLLFSLYFICKYASVVTLLYWQPNKNDGNKTLYTKLLETLIRTGFENSFSLVCITFCISKLAGAIVAAVVFVTKVVSYEIHFFKEHVVILFFLLSIKTDIVSMSFKEKTEHFNRHITLITLAMLRFLHSICKKDLIRRASSPNSRIISHWGSLFICFSNISLAAVILFLHYDDRYNPGPPLVIPFFCALICFKSIILLCLYCFVLLESAYAYDSLNMEDYKLFLSILNNGVEYLGGFMLFINAVQMNQESNGYIRAMAISFHVLYNLSERGRQGFEVIHARYLIYTKLSQLSDASDEQLDEHRDVCGICLEEMESAKVTNCQHFFHRPCLRRWLIIHDTCPMCHKSILNYDIL